MAANWSSSGMAAYKNANDMAANGSHDEGRDA